MYVKKKNLRTKRHKHWTIRLNFLLGVYTMVHV